MFDPETGDEASGAEVVLMYEVGCGVLVFRDHLPAQVDVTDLPPELVISAMTLLERS